MHGIHHNTPADVKLICGVKLQKMITAGAYTATQLALLGRDLQAGKAAITNASPRQTAAITGIPMALTRAAGKATLVEIMAMETGALTVEEVHMLQLKQSRLSDEAVEQVINAIGPDRVLAAFDRLTEPDRSVLVNDMSVPVNDMIMPVKGNGVIPAHLNI